MSKTAKIVKCLWTNEWENPKGYNVHYHELTLDNGEILPCGSKDKYPDHLKEGSKIDYEVVNGKIKIVKEEYSGTSAKQTTSPTSSTTQKAASAPVKKNNYGGRQHKQTDFLGYAFSYAKDLVAAGKATAKDRKLLIQTAREIYDEIGKILDEENGG